MQSSACAGIAHLRVRDLIFSACQFVQLINWKLEVCSYEGWLWRAVGWSSCVLPHPSEPSTECSFGRTTVPKFPIGSSSSGCLAGHSTHCRALTSGVLHCLHSVGEGIQSTHRPQTSSQSEILWHKQTSWGSKSLIPSFDMGSMCFSFLQCREAEGCWTLQSSKHLRGLSMQSCCFFLKSIAFIMAHV